MLGLPAGYPRKPALPLDENAKEEVKKLVDYVAGLNFNLLIRLLTRSSSLKNSSIWRWPTDKCAGR